jgi:hypothetical protein
MQGQILVLKKTTFSLLEKNWIEGNQISEANLPSRFANQHIKI